MVGAERVTALTRAVQQAAKSEDFEAIVRDLPKLELAITETHRVLAKALGTPPKPVLRG